MFGSKQLNVLAIGIDDNFQKLNHKHFLYYDEQGALFSIPIFFFFIKAKLKTGTVDAHLHKLHKHTCSPLEIIKFC